ncbi:hypothetical protein GNF78_15940 [Clostridium perfringens]
MEVQKLIDGLTQMDELHVKRLEILEQKKQSILNRNYEELVGTLWREAKLV